jgi:methionyl-tRNA formyltransferase
VNWAIINGERETGNSLIWLAPDVDAGELIDQVAFPITPHDTCATLYDLVALSNRTMLLRLLPRLLKGERPGKPQQHTDEPVLHRRRPKDGLVQWERSGEQVYDFIRALTRPYPGAFSGLDGVEWKIWQAALAPGKGNGHEPGQVLGPVLSPIDDANGQLVACGNGGVILLEVESGDGRVLKGKALAEQDWIGKQWHHD